MSRCCWAAVRPGCVDPVVANEEEEGVATLLMLVEDDEDEKGRGVLARSARLLDALLTLIRSLPLSSRSERIMASISVGARRGCEQKVHGPIPSLTQIILPQF